MKLNCPVDKMPNDYFEDSFQVNVLNKTDFYRYLLSHFWIFMF